MLRSMFNVSCGAAAMLLLAGGMALAQESVSALKEHDTRSPIDISADRLEVRSKDDIAVFEGRVEAVQKDLTLKADRITVYYDKAAGQKTGATNSGESPPISRIDAAGKVTLVSPSETVAANWGVYDMVERIVTLGGAVVLNRGDVVVRGDRLQVNLESGVTRLETVASGPGATEEKGRVRGRFLPSDKNPSGGAQEKPGS